jgi:hypothetical protein
MVRSFFAAILVVSGFPACHDLSGRESMSGTPTQKEPEQQAKRGSIRKGTTIKAVGHGLRFEIPAAWVRWYEENEAHPNLHLTPDDLDMVKETEGEWDREFALVVNTILSFNQCVAHVGSEGWGPQGISFADLQVRAYVLTDTPEQIEERTRSQGSAVVENLTGTRAVPQQEQVGAWRRTVIKYFRMYNDYGATAIVDLRIRRLNDRTIVFAFMYTDHTEHDTEINELLKSVVFSGQ